MAKQIEPTDAHEYEINLIEVAKKIWLGRWLVVKITAIFGVISIFYALSLDNIYKATVTMLPQSQESSVGQFSGLAAIAGIDLNSNSTSNEVFYEDVLKSNFILDKLITKKWFVQQENKEMFLAEFLKLEKSESHSDPVAKLNYDLKKYFRENSISFTSSKENGLMALSVSMPLDPILSANIANWLSLELHKYNDEFREKKASETVLNVKNQLNNTKKKLVKAENVLKEFQKSNKNFSQSAELQLENNRYTREVLTENSVYTELRKQYEIAQINLDKSKQSITILDSAIFPVLKDGPRRSIICILITFIGAILAMILVLFIQSKSKKVLV